jgi:hypothetical protein
MQLFTNNKTLPEIEVALISEIIKKNHANRSYDDQSFISIKIETEAKIAIQEKIKNNEAGLCWSYILDIENDNNPFIERKKKIEKLKAIALYDIEKYDQVDKIRF